MALFDPFFDKDYNCQIKRNEEKVLAVPEEECDEYYNYKYIVQAFDEEDAIELCEEHHMSKAPLSENKEMCALICACSETN